LVYRIVAMESKREEVLVGQWGGQVLCMKSVIVAVISLAAFIAAVSLKATGYSILGASPPPISQWVIGSRAVALGCMYFFLTLAGIAAGVVFDGLATVDENAPLTARQVLGLLQTARAWRGIVASPLIFLTVYMGVAGNPVTVPFVLLAFQNGFFWKSVMSRLLGHQ